MFGRWLSRLLCDVCVSVLCQRCDGALEITMTIHFHVFTWPFSAFIVPSITTTLKLYCVGEPFHPTCNLHHSQHNSAVSTSYRLSYAICMYSVCVCVYLYIHTYQTLDVLKLS